MLSAAQILLLEQLPGVGKSSILAIDSYLQARKLTFPFLNKEILDLLEEVKGEYKRLRLPSLEDITMANEASEHIIEQSDNQQIKILSIQDPGFPPLLKNIHDRPLLVHVQGNLDALKAPTVAIIGTREPSEHALQAGPKLTSYFVEAGFTIVSGLALGCDTIGHQAAVDRQKPTVAVLAGGLHSIYPKENKTLAYKILHQGGLLLSELPYGKAPGKSTFVDRDRLQSGLSLGVVVLETGVKGGTLHTVGFAADQNRPVACMYSHVKSKGGFDMHEKFQGNKMLVQENKAVALDSTAAIEDYMAQLLNTNTSSSDNGNLGPAATPGTSKASFSNNSQLTLF